MQDAEVVDMEENYARVSLSICLSQHCGRSFLSSPPVKFDLLTGSSDGQSTHIRIFLKFIDCTRAVQFYLKIKQRFISLKTRFSISIPISLGVKEIK